MKKPTPPAYANPMGPTAVAKKTMPTRHLFDKAIPFEYTNKDNTDIRKRFNRMLNK